MEIDKSKLQFSEDESRKISEINAICKAYGDFMREDLERIGVNLDEFKNKMMGFKKTDIYSPILAMEGYFSNIKILEGFFDGFLLDQLGIWPFVLNFQYVLKEIRCLYDLDKNAIVTPTMFEKSRPEKKKNGYLV